MNIDSDAGLVSDDGVFAYPVIYRPCRSIIAHIGLYLCSTQSFFGLENRATIWTSLTHFNQ